MGRPSQPAKLDPRRALAWDVPTANAISAVRNFLEKRMRLQVNEAKSGVRKPDEVAFLGFSFSFRCTKRTRATLSPCFPLEKRSAD